MRLFLCEKPSQGKDIARVVGATQRSTGYLSGPDVCVTWCIGHLLETSPPEAYNPSYKSWSLDHLPIIPEDWKVEVKPKTATQFKVVKKLLGQAKELVIATDADREGELIAREIMEYCGYRGPVHRLWLSALNPESIRKALATLKPGEETFYLYHAALARSRADWLIGMNLTRLFTLIARRCGHDQVMSVGRVQTPALYLTVIRERTINAFVKQPYWEVEVTLRAEGAEFLAKWKPQGNIVDAEGRCIDRTQADQALRQLTHGQATVTAVNVEPVSERPPLPFDMAALQEQCDRQFGMGVEETLNIAQSLYETHKATHYPRTECPYLPESMLTEVPTVIAALAKTDPSFVPLLQKLDLTVRSQAWDDVKLAGPHHGIIPTTEAADISKMSENERKVYDLIRRRYIAQFMPHHEYNRTVVMLDSSGRDLKAVGKQIVVPGWKVLFTRDDEAEGDEQAQQKSQHLPNLQSGQACGIQSAELKSLSTSPPRRFTEGTLLKAMKNIADVVEDPRLKAKLKATTGIGTQATRASIIKGLMQRGYLDKKGRSLSPTSAAFALIDTVPSMVKDPGMTAIWEQASDEIEAGRMPLETFLKGQSVWIGKLVEQCSQLTLSIDQPPSPPCPTCGAPMRKRNGKNGPFMSCSKYPECKGILSLTPKKKTRKK
ncbi:DNA topoisomerase III [Pseudomonas quasicaspiana]|nr:DNA topoisomerase III [Pseudomonas quasicaspiana]